MISLSLYYKEIIFEYISEYIITIIFKNAVLDNSIDYRL